MRGRSQRCQNSKVVTSRTDGLNNPPWTEGWTRHQVVKRAKREELNFERCSVHHLCITILRRAYFLLCQTIKTNKFCEAVPHLLRLSEAEHYQLLKRKINISGIIRLVQMLDIRQLLSYSSTERIELRRAIVMTHRIPQDA
jgi:hypothetical protein